VGVLVALLETETVQTARPVAAVAQQLVAGQELAVKALAAVAATFTQQERAAARAVAALARLTLTLVATVVQATHGLMVLPMRAAVEGAEQLQAQTAQAKILMVAVVQVAQTTQVTAATAVCLNSVMLARNA
jgi:hypothetical protein